MAAPEAEADEPREEDLIVEIVASARELIGTGVPADEAVALIVSAYEAMGVFPQGEAGTRLMFEVRRRLDTPE